MGFNIRFALRNRVRPPSVPVTKAVRKVLGGAGYCFPWLRVFAHGILMAWNASLASHKHVHTQRKWPIPFFLPISAYVVHFQGGVP